MVNAFVLNIGDYHNYFKRFFCVFISRWLKGLKAFKWEVNE